MIEPVYARTNDARLLNLSDGIRNQLAVAMAQVRSFKVTSVSPLSNNADQATDAMTFLLRIDLQNEQDVTRITATLTDPGNELIWAQSYDYPAAASGNIEKQFVASFMPDIRPKIASAAKRTLILRGGTAASAWEAYLKATWVAGSDQSKLEATKQRISDARAAIAISPDFAQAHAVLAEKLAHITTIDPESDTKENRNEAFAHAQKAVQLDPTDPDVIYNVATYHWHVGHNDLAGQFMQRTLQLDPYYPTAAFFAPLAPFTCKAPPKEAIANAIAQDAALSPGNPFRWLTQTWIALLYVNAGQWQEAEEAAAKSVQIYISPDNLLRYAAILVHNGKTEAALEQVDHLRPYWPTLDISHFAKATIKGRRCSESATPPEGLIEMYQALAEAAAKRS